MVRTDDADTFTFPPCGTIFKFRTMTHARAFAAAVKSRYGLDSRVFDDEEEAARSHMYPFVQEPPVVHVDRPWWGTAPDTARVGQGVVARKADRTVGRAGVRRQVRRDLKKGRITGKTKQTRPPDTSPGVIAT